MSLILMKQENFGAIKCDFYKSGEEILMTREQIGQALEYKDPMVAIAKIHLRNPDRFEKFSFTTSVNGRETYFYSSKGVYEICRWSRQPKADEFIDWAWDVIDNLRKYVAHLKTDEWQQARLDNKATNKDLNDAIQKFVGYAISQGSINWQTYYNHFANLSNKVVNIQNGKRDLAHARQLIFQTIVSEIIMNTIEESINEGLPYKSIYQLCKERVIDITSKAYLRIS